MIWYATKGRRVFHGRRQKTIVRASRLQGDTLRHPNEKPESLMRQLVEGYVPPGELAIDPFAGSGSTGKAAILEGFQFVGFELDPQYTAIANARVEAARASLCP